MISSLIKFPYKFFKTNILRRFNLPVAPHVVVYKVTNRCNMRCVMCGNFNVEREPKELTVSETKDAFRDPCLQRINVIRFTGGEPFIRQDLKYIIDAIQQTAHPKLFFITSNGTLYERMEDLIKYVVPKGVALNIQVSLDALGEEHDRIRQVKGAGDLVKENLLRLNRLRDEYKFFIGVNQTVSKINLTKIKEVNAFCKKNNFVHMFILASKYHESNEMTDFKDFNTKFELYEPISKEGLRSFYDILDEIEKNSHPRTFYEWLRHSTENYIHYHAKNRLLKSYLSPLPKCMAYFNYIRIMPDGSVIPCTLRSDLSIGNLKDQPFSRMWRSAAAGRGREAVRQCPGCWVQCDIVPSIPFSPHFYKWIFSNRIKNS
ncbi:radical SAM protein [Candidatus Omnitrophota bacterium]